MTRNNASERRKDIMERMSFGKRFLKPVIFVLLTLLVSNTAYFYLSWQISHPTLRAIFALVSSAVLFISIGFGAVYIYPVAYFRGAGIGERIIACLITPIIWNIKEMVRVSEFFTVGETLYYGLNTVFILSIFGAFGLMGLCELICRWRAGKRGGESIRILSAAPIVSMIMGLAALYVCLLWGMGVHFFYIYIQGYRMLFT
jgi:hypothetical protein